MSKNKTNRENTIPLLALALLIVATPSVGLAGEMIVTGISGHPRANGVSLLIHDRLSERAEAIELETNPYSGISVLYGDAISLQLGPSTRVLVNPATDQRGELIELLSGELRSVTRRDRSKKRPEIHTPSAVIRPSTTTLHLFVDPVSGDTEATSLESRAWVVSSNPIHKQSAILNSGQQVTIKMGEAPETIRKLEADLRADVTGFLSGTRLRDAALDHDMKREGQLALSQIASNDVPETTLPSVASPFPTPSGLDFGSEIRYRDPICANTIECQPMREFSRTRFEDPALCDGILGELCRR